MSLDPNSFPHIAELIVRDCVHSTLLSLRATNNSWRQLVDMTLARHIIVTEHDDKFSPDIVYHFTTPSGRHPALQPSGYVSWLWERETRASSLLSHTVILDLNGRVTSTLPRILKALSGVTGGRGVTTRVGSAHHRDNPIPLYSYLKPSTVRYIGDWEGSSYPPDGAAHIVIAPSKGDLHVDLRWSHATRVTITPRPNVTLDICWPWYGPPPHDDQLSRALVLQKVVILCTDHPKRILHPKRRGVLDGTWLNYWENVQVLGSSAVNHAPVTVHLVAVDIYNVSVYGNGWGFLRQRLPCQLGNAVYTGQEEYLADLCPEVVRLETCV